MIYLIICTVMIYVTVQILRDTHIKVYYKGYSARKANLTEEYDLQVQVWQIIPIILLGIIPLVNFIAFLAFCINHCIHSSWNPDNCDYETSVFSLNGNTFITRTLKKISYVLNKSL